MSGFFYTQKPKLVFQQKIIYFGFMEKADTKLQIERIVFFSDAVIAIAMTLLIIEIKAPHIQNHSDAAVMESLSELIPKFIAFFISFFVIAIYWKSHHHLFGHLKSFTPKLLWLNIAFLLSIVLMPFSSAFYSENFGLNVPYAFYCINISITGLLNCWLVRYIASGKANLSTVAGNTNWRRYYTYRSLVPPFVFLFSMLLSFYSAGLSRLSFIVIFPLIAMINRNFKRKGLLE